jgi:hypothetical protein
MATGSGTGTPAAGTFTYTDTLLTDRDKVRFEIGDVVSGSGPRPHSGYTNFTDNEISAVVTREGSWGAAAAKLAEVLASEWTAAAGDVSMADYRENYTARAEYFRKRAQDLRTQYGGGVSVTQVAPTRVDGFSDDVDAEET